MGLGGGTLPFGFAPAGRLSAIGGASRVSRDNGRIVAATLAQSSSSSGDRLRTAHHPLGQQDQGLALG